MSHVQRSRVVGEQAYVAIAMATRKFMDGTHQLIISRLIVQALFEVPAVCVLRLNGKNDTGAAGPNDLVTFLQHFPKHGGGGTGAGSNAIAALVLAVVDFS